MAYQALDAVKKETNPEVMVSQHWSVSVTVLFFPDSMVYGHIIIFIFVV